MIPVVQTVNLPARHYDLAATLSSGQAFRWRQTATGWEGVIAGRWVHLTQSDDGISARAIASIHSTVTGTNPSRWGLSESAAVPTPPAAGAFSWDWLTDYLRTDVDLDAVLRTFPDDAPMRTSVAACRGLRLLRQEPWECLVSFICSSTKQIVQIRQIIEQVCERLGEPVPQHAGTPEGLRMQCRATWARAFPTPERLAAASELDLRTCKMGFRAPYVLAAAQAVEAGQLDLEGLRVQSCDEARATLTRLPGVGPKIANCVLLFAYGFQAAFPVDVWVMKALRELYFPKRRPTPERLNRFIRTHFGPNAGYAQQYLFHYMRTRR